MVFTEAVPTHAPLCQLAYYGPDAGWVAGVGHLLLGS